jgi:hypothetical protein
MMPIVQLRTVSRKVQEAVTASSSSSSSSSDMPPGNTSGAGDHQVARDAACQLLAKLQAALQSSLTQLNR